MEGGLSGAVDGIAPPPPHPALKMAQKKVCTCENEGRPALIWRVTKIRHGEISSLSRKKKKIQTLSKRNFLISRGQCIRES